MSNRHLWLVQAFTRGMADRRFGRIVFITSDTFWALPPSALLAYVASKGAAGVMRTLAVTLGADGIAVSAAAPGLTDTPGLPRREHRRTVRRNGAPPGDWARRPCTSTASCTCPPARGSSQPAAWPPTARARTLSST